MRFLLLILWLSFFVTLILLAWSKKKHFYSNTPGLYSLGIYVWGDALALAPFWLVSGILFYFLSIKLILSYFIVFFCLRSGFEVVYWLLFQFFPTNHTPAPDIIGLLKEFSPDQRAILYQVLHFGLMILGIGLLMFIWTKH